MRAAATVTSTGIAVKYKNKTVKAETVVMHNVDISGMLRGVVTETIDKAIRPNKAVAGWPKLQFVCSMNKYVDTATKQTVTEAQAVYMVGRTIHYLP